MKQYPVAYNPILEYHQGIESGEITVSKKVKSVVAHLVRIVQRDDVNYHYDAKKGNKAIEFFENFLKHSKGKTAGQPFILELWQKCIVGATFGIVHRETGARKYRELLLIVARKNGKSTLSAGIGLYGLVADGESGAEIYSAATKREQAKIIWDEAKRMVKKSPVMARFLKTTVSDISFPMQDGVFKPLASDSNTLDGLNVHFSLIDELHAIDDVNLYDVIIDGMSAREQPLSVITTTAGTVRNGIYDLKYEEAERVIQSYDSDNPFGDTLLPFIYELDERNEWVDAEAWPKANPALGTVKKIDELERKVAKAKDNPYLVVNLLTKDFNVPQSSVRAWMQLEQISNSATYDFESVKPRYAIGGVDLSSTTDLTSACMLWYDRETNEHYCKVMFWIPEALVQKKVHEEKIPYDVWIEKGYIRTCDGNQINQQDVVEWFKEMQYEHDVYWYKIGFDEWSASHFAHAMKEEFGDVVMQVVRQGKKTLSAPMKMLGAMIERKELNYNNNPVLKWNMTNVAVDVDKNGNIQPDKTNQRKRIDGFAALLDAYVVMVANLGEYDSII